MREFVLKGRKEEEPRMSFKGLVWIPECHGGIGRDPGLEPEQERGKMVCSDWVS